MMKHIKQFGMNIAQNFFPRCSRALQMETCRSTRALQNDWKIKAVHNNAFAVF